jgi:hypothetical protein
VTRERVRDPDLIRTLNRLLSDKYRAKAARPRGRRQDDPLHGRIRDAAKIHLKRDGGPNISKIARACDCDRQTVRVVINSD